MRNFQFCLVSFALLLFAAAAAAQRTGDEESVTKVKLSGSAKENKIGVGKKRGVYFVKAEGHTNSPGNAFRRVLLSGLHPVEVNCNYGVGGGGVSSTMTATESALPAAARDDEDSRSGGSIATFRLTMEFFNGKAEEPFPEIKGLDPKKCAENSINWLGTVYYSGKPIYTIDLAKDAKENGYKIGNDGGVVTLTANDVVDPITKKLLEGLKVLRYKCGPGGSAKRKDILFSGGQSQRVRMNCFIVITPRVLLMDEPTSGVKSEAQ